MKSKLVKSLIAVAIAAIVGFGGYYGYNALSAKKTVAASVQYYNIAARKMNLQVTIQGTGAAYAAVTKDVAPNNNGTLKDLNLKVGDTVTAGQKLFVSDSDDLRKAVTNAQNNLAKQNLSLSSDQSALNVDSNKIAMDNLAISDAKTQLSDANNQLNKMTVTAPIGGVVTAVNNSNGDSVSNGKSILTIVDMSSMKVKVSVDELDIGKVKIGQAAAVKFDAVKDKTYEGTVETIAQTGTSSNNVTTYDVVVAIKNPSGIKLGMNANVTISVESKENALVIPTEALVDNNGQKYVRLVSSDSSSTTGSNQTPSSSNAQSTQSSKLTAVKTGLETENYVEITDGLKEGDKVQIRSTQSSSSSINKNNQGAGFGGDMGGFGGPQGGNGAPPSQGGSNGGASQGGSKN